MKSIQIIDGALNCTYDIYLIDEHSFLMIFPGEDQDVEFVDDFVERVGSEHAQIILDRLWGNLQDKKQIHGIHGTLFFELHYKKQYYPTKRESEMKISICNDS